jgi:hypothetical protein
MEFLKVLGSGSNESFDVILGEAVDMILFHSIKLFNPINIYIWNFQHNK